MVNQVRQDVHREMEHTSEGLMSDPDASILIFGEFTEC